MKKKLTKEQADKMMKMEGETRGFNLEHDARWTLKEKGREGLKKVEKRLEELGFSLKYEKLRLMDFYPAGLRGVSLLAIRDVFDLDSNEVKNVCAFHPKVSLVIRLFGKHLVSVPRAMKAAPQMWKKYWTKGELVFVKYDAEKNYCILKIEDFDLHPLFCGPCLEGYLATMVGMILGKEKVECEEVKCTFTGDEHHEYLIKWD